MSSILDALEKIEATGGPQAPLGSDGGSGPGRPWMIVALVVTAVVAGAGGALLVRERAASAPVPAAPVAEPIVVAQAPARIAPTLPATSTTLAAVEPVAAVAAPVPAPAPSQHERPWGAEPDTPRPPPPPPLPPPAPAQAVARPTPPPTTPAPPRATVEEPPARPAAKLPAGAPRMRISFLVYSSLAERRSVALTIGDAGLTTLREGDESNGVQVVRIYPDHVELRWQGEAFTLEVRS